MGIGRASTSVDIIWVTGQKLKLRCKKSKPQDICSEMYTIPKPQQKIIIIIIRLIFCKEDAVSDV